MKNYIMLIIGLLGLSLSGCIADSTTAVEQGSSSVDVSSSGAIDSTGLSSSNFTSSSSATVLVDDSIVTYQNIEDLQSAVGHVVDTLGAERYCTSIDTALPHGLNPEVEDFVRTMKMSGVAPDHYDSLVTSMSVLRCHIRVNTADTIIYEITHEGNAANGLIPLHKIINVEINGIFYADTLDTEMQAVVKQHQSYADEVSVFPPYIGVIK